MNKIGKLMKFRDPSQNIGCIKYLWNNPMTGRTWCQCMAFLENGNWLGGYSGRGIVMMRQELVTHWMPLPEPPEEAAHD